MNWTCASQIGITIRAHVQCQSSIQLIVDRALTAASIWLITGSPLSPLSAYLCYRLPNSPILQTFELTRLHSFLKHNVTPTTTATHHLGPVETLISVAKNRMPMQDIHHNPHTPRKASASPHQVRWSRLDYILPERHRAWWTKDCMWELLKLYSTRRIWYTNAESPQNKTNSAVQIIHKPTGIVVKCQATRSRSQNAKTARSLLADRVEELEKGDQSRTALKAAAAKKKKASSLKKTRRKYRKLEGNDEEPGKEPAVEQEEQQLDDVEGHEKRNKEVEGQTATPKDSPSA